MYRWIAVTLLLFIVAGIPSTSFSSRHENALDRCFREQIALIQGTVLTRDPLRLSHRHGKQLAVLENDSIYRIVEVDTPYLATGKLAKDGELVLNFMLKTREGRAQYIRGSEAFKEIMGHFGPRVKKIRGIWQTDTAAELSDNFDAFTRLIHPPHSLSFEEAAARTWTGEQARKAGFTKVTIDDVDYDEKTGRMLNVEVLFERP